MSKNTWAKKLKNLDQRMKLRKYANDLLPAPRSSIVIQVMKVVRTGNKMELFIEGSIGESHLLYTYKLENPEVLVLHMEKVASINSIGIRNWVVWTTKIPSSCKVILSQCPYVIVNQTNMVQGFLPKNSVIESFYAYYNCPNCSYEKSILLEKDKHYTYATKATPSSLSLPTDIACSKCKTVMEEDFIAKKFFGFLDTVS